MTIDVAGTSQLQDTHLQPAPSPQRRPEPRARLRAKRPAPDPARRAARIRAASVLSAYLGIAVWLLGSLWRHLPNGRLAMGGVDQYLFEWFLWHGPHALFHGENPLFTTLWNPPDGANLMANTSVLGLALPLAPVTALFGPQASLVLAITVGLAGSAAAWFWLFRRLLPGATLGPVVGGAFCGFAPAMVSHANGAHLNILFSGLIPFVIATALGLTVPGRALRGGLTLGLLVTYQVFIGEELLLLTAIGLGLFCLAYAALRWRPAMAALPNLLRRLGVALLVAAPLLAYPLWIQFVGPQHYTGIAGVSSTVNDVLSLTTLPSQSFVGDPASTGEYVLYHNEENAFWGVPLVILLVVGVWRLRRELLVRLSATMIVLAAALSLGTTVHVDGRSTVPGPWAVVGRLPILDSVVVSRMTLLAIPFIGLLLALMTVRALDVETARVRRFALLAIVAALVPLVPTPLPVTNRPPIPDFITSGAWTQVIRRGSTVMTVPMTMSNGGIDTINWQVPSDGQFSLVGGYFVGPHRDDHSGHYFPDNTPTQRMVNNLWLTGKAPAVTEVVRERARTDLDALRVDVIVVADRGHTKEVLALLTDLLGLPPVRVDDVWTWRMRDGIAVRSAI